MKELLDLLNAKEFRLWRDAIASENRMAIQMLAISGLPISVANIFAQTFFSRRELFTVRTLWLGVYFLVLLLCERFFLPKNFKYSTLLIYLLEIPIMVVSILLGTVWDPDHQALTFLLFLMAMPVFILDRPLRLVGISAGWSLLFLLLCLLVKDPSTNRGDFFHTLEFFLASTTVTLIVLRVRLEMLRNYYLTRYNLEHDPMTGLQNQRSLEGCVGTYLNRPMIVLLGDLDQLRLYNDFYGKKTGDQMLLCFAGALTEVFGQEHCFRLGGDELLCLLTGQSERELLDRAARCRDMLRGREFNGSTLSLTCSFGYVMGTADCESVFHQMVHLADIYAHKASRHGQGQTVGGPYDEVTLRAAVVESRIASESRAKVSDELTGLPSLVYFTSRPVEELEENPNPARTLVVGFFHVTRFRDFNSEFGYAQGDALINYSAKLLRRAFPGRSICHINGSQFGLLCYEDEVDEGLHQVDDALKSYKPDYPILGKAGFVACRAGESMMSLLDKAKAAHDAVYHDPARLYGFYDNRMDAENNLRHYLLTHVDEAIQQGWLKVYYQPIVRAMTGEICNEEALTRWDDPQYGFLSPFQFIPTLEEAHQIYKVSLFVVRRVLEDLKTKKERGLTPVPVSVNLSRYDFTQCDMVRAVTELVDRAGLSRELIRIEITESAFLSDQELLIREVNRFRQNGFQVWMDDFGSEYSTLNMLRKVNFDLIKIDMEFMKNFKRSGKNSIIVSNIINMAQRMGLGTLIEGIETEEQYQFMRKLGCERLQGYLFSKPRSLENLLELACNPEGIKYEDPGDAAYYEDIGRVDLNAPLSAGGEDTGRSDSGSIPSGILEYRNGGFTCIRGNDAFFSLLQKLELLSPSRMGTDRRRLIDPPPAELTAAAEACVCGRDWAEAVTERIRENALSLRLRRVSGSSARGSTALLAVLLPIAAK